MNTQNNQLAYQEAAVGNAGPIDLVVMLYDILARDLQRAIAAMEAGDIEARSKHIKHGFLALQQLDATLNMEEGGALATNMSRFYSMMRSQMMKAQIQKEPAVLQQLLQLLFSVREAWVEMKVKLSPGNQGSAPARSRSPYDQPEARSASWNG